jgi:hypothetical protein
MPVRRAGRCGEFGEGTAEVTVEMDVGRGVDEALPAWIYDFQSVSTLPPGCTSTRALTEVNVLPVFVSA